jgi:hypothetical protein
MNQTSGPTKKPLSAPHARTRERTVALFDITQHGCARWRTGRDSHRDGPGARLQGPGSRRAFVLSSR